MTKDIDEGMSHRQAKSQNIYTTAIATGAPLGSDLALCFPMHLPDFDRAISAHSGRQPQRVGGFKYRLHVQPDIEGWACTFAVHSARA